MHPIPSQVGLNVRDEQRFVSVGAVVTRKVAYWLNFNRNLSEAVCVITALAITADKKQTACG